MQVESIVIEFSDLRTSRSGHAAGAKGPALDCIIWSVVASIHCLITGAGTLLPSMLVLTCHSPGLRDGNSAGSAGLAQNRTRIEVAPIDRTKSPVSGHIAASGRRRKGSRRIN